MASSICYNAHMKIVPGARHSSDTSDIAHSDSGLTLRHHDSQYWLEFSFNGQRYFSEAKYLLLNMGELKAALDQPITMYRVTGNEKYEEVAGYNLAEESRGLLVKGWKHAVVGSNVAFLKSIASVSLVCVGALSAVVLGSGASPVLPLTFALAGVASALYVYLSMRAEIPKGVKAAASLRKHVNQQS